MTQTPKPIRAVRWLVRALVSPDLSARQEARHVILSRLALRMGFRVYNRDRTWHQDADFLRVWEGFPESNGIIHERKYVLYSIARAVRSLPGATVECGVFSGGSSYLICRALSENDRPEHHIFDSFEGLSAPNEVDSPVAGAARPWETGDLAVTQERVAKNLAEFDHVFLHRGWIPERFELVADRQFRLVHIDVDLYAPTRASLEFFYPRLVPGGVIVCDDYGSARCPGATKACDEFAAATPQRSMIHLTTGQGLLFKQDFKQDVLDGRQSAKSGINVH